MDIDTILRAEEGDKEEYSEDSATEEPEALFFMEPDHEEVRTKKRSRGTKVLGVGTHDRNHQHSEDRECRSLPEVLLTLQSQGTHQSKLPRKKKTGSSAMDKEARALREEDRHTKRIQNRKRMWKRFTNKPGTTRRQYTGAQMENAQALQQSEDDL